MCHKILFSIFRKLNYVTQVSEGYKVQEMKSVIQLNKYLATNALINQTDHRLTGPEIEVVALGKKFLFRYPPPANDDKAVANEKRDKHHVASSIVQYKDQLNTTLRSCESTLGNKGHLKPSAFTSRAQQSQSNPAKRMRWEKEPPVLEQFASYTNIALQRASSGAGKAVAYTHPALLRASKFLKEQKEFKISEADKGGVQVLWKCSDYEKEALRQLSDEDNYQLLALETNTRLISQAIYPTIVQLTMKRVCKERNAHIRYLEENGHISRRESMAMQVVEENQRMPYIYLKPKINKPFHPTTGTFQARAVVSTVCGPLHALDSYLAAITSPILRVLPGMLKNSDDLIEQIASVSADAREEGKRTLCPAGHSNEHFRFASADVVALYPSIGVEEGLLAASDVYDYFHPWLVKLFQREQRLPPPSPEKFKELMRFMFDNSYIAYENQRFFKQKKGTPMGGCISTFFANAFMYVRTRESLKNPPSGLIINLRFLDDFFFAYCSHPSHGANLIDDYLAKVSNDNVKCVQVACTEEGAADADALTATLKTLRVAGEKGIACNILDVTIMFDPVTSTFQSKPFMKKIAVPSYIYQTSNQPKKELDNIPLAAFDRLKRISSSPELYKEASYRVSSGLRMRGYARLVCFMAQKRVNEKQRLSHFSTTAETLVQRRAPEMNYNTINLNAKYVDGVDWKAAQDCLNKVHDFVANHYAYSENKSALLSRRRSRVVFSRQNQKLAGANKH